MDLFEFDTVSAYPGYIFEIEKQSLIGRQSSCGTKRNLDGSNIVVLLTNPLNGDVKFTVHAYLINEAGYYYDVNQNYLDGQKKIEHYNNSSGILRFIFRNLGIRKTGQWRLLYALNVKIDEKETVMLLVKTCPIRILSSKAYLAQIQLNLIENVN
ncbi:uncharacterized protein ASCRUDRAFT_70128 [Ascoidea rubescens DSM 1968]|uniref:Velvet domain-containing protein n=1 Tax=Ascoidea rubescens DSM 1968 TaxID=1344418 RepID=A0A1D2VJ48_9ASCO|nr:hypothetical protein ASCRUDRAFT_70128 [Ascoidea rubescens DSM 1968]ODV61661.1 hypothetical protein ASCRUDRAFT_70128 [Ascoidea rubescens DSM 1968]